MARILLIDDNAPLVAVLAEALAQVGHSVATAGDGSAGIRCAGAERFDIVVTDVVMPEADGAEVMAALRRLPVRPQVIAISGGGAIEPGRYLTMARAMGAAAVLQKPFPPSRLVSEVARLTGPPPAPRG
jgi:CheY-like chemotaxis protein